MQASLNSYLVGRYNIADVIVGETDTIFYEENIEAVGLDSVRFTSNVKHDDHYLLYSYAAEVQNSGNNIALEIKWPTGPAREPWVMTSKGSQIISNLDEFVILYGLYFGNTGTWENRHAVFRRVK